MAVVFFTAGFIWFMFEANANGIKYYEKFDATSSPAETNAATDEGEPAQTTSAPSSAAVKPEVSNPVAQSAKADASYFAKCAFVGSTAASEAAKKVGASDKTVYFSDTITAATLETKILPTAYGQCNALHALSKQMPKMIYIVLDTKAIDYSKADEVLTEITDFFDLLSAAIPSASVCVTSLTPATRQSEALEEGALTREAADVFNAKLLNECTKHKVHYLSVSDSLKDAEGYLDAKYTAEDGSIYYDKLYTDMASYILTHTVKYE